MDFRSHELFCRADYTKPVDQLQINQDKILMCRKIIDDKLSLNQQIVINAIKQTRDNNHQCTVIDACINEDKIIFDPKSSSIADLL